MASINQRYIIYDVPQEIFSVRFSSDGALLATGCNDGAVRIYNGKTGGSVLQTLRPTPECGGPLQGSEELTVQLPITAMRFRPGSHSRGVILACSADASVRHWHVPTGKCLSTIFEGSDQQVFACDYRQDGRVFATGGKDKRVRLYDESRLSLSSGLGSSVAASKGRAPPSSAPSGIAPIATFGGNILGTSIDSVSGNSTSNDSAIGAGGSHSNRIFAVCFHPFESDIILSGGWDNTIQIWDARVSGAGHGAVRSMFGSHLCGDALQVTPDGNYVISGSWRPDDALQVWDLRSGSLVSSIPFLRSNSEVKPYLNAVSKARNSNGVFNSSIGETPRPSPPPLNRFSVPSAPLRSVNPVTSPPTVPAYEKPDPTLIYSISFSKNSSDLNGEGQSPGSYVFAGGSGGNGGNVFHTQDLLSFANDINSIKAGSSLTAIAKDQGKECPPEVMESLAGAKEIVPPLQARSCRPLVASISGLARGVFASDWDGNNGLVVVGGDQPIRVFDVCTSGESSLKNISVGKGGGVKKRVGGRVGSLIATETSTINTSESMKSTDEINNQKQSVLTEFVSGDAAAIFCEPAIPPPAPINTSGLKPPPAVLLALAASKATSSAALVMTIESPECEVIASKSISVYTVTHEAEVKDALSSNTLSAWEEDNTILHDNNVKTMSDDIAVVIEDEVATFDAGYRKNANSSSSNTRALVNPPSTNSQEALEECVRRNSGAVDALRALIEGTREKEFEKEA